MTDHRLIRDPRGFYTVVEEIRRAASLELYEDSYYESMRDTDRRFEVSQDARTELHWQTSTTHADWIFELRALQCGSRVLDIGAGLGELVGSLMEAGFDVTGLEPSRTAVEFARERGRPLQVGSIPGSLSGPEYDGAWDVITLINVLEHVADASSVLREMSRLLVPGGILVVRVPNDFSEMQESARRYVKAESWWISIPHHLYYFDFASLGRFAADFGFTEVARTTDFPMEMFLLMGEDYTRDGSVGRAAHSKRRNFDLNLSPETRRKFYKSLAAAGLGRSATLFLKKEF
jgi:2-polyprenyl-3-methyl-5-hydroxy-6-metoxy-1,4-benzoquinol methylase